MCMHVGMYVCLRRCAWLIVCKNNCLSNVIENVKVRNLIARLDAYPNEYIYINIYTYTYKYFYT